MAAYQMWTIRVLVLTVVLCGGVPSGAVRTPLANRFDAAAMHAIAKSTGWGVDQSLDPCSWPGVSCNMVGRITSIVASHAGLHGNISGDDLSKLTFLSNLDLSFNRLSGSLPVVRTPLQFLRAVDLGSNSFTYFPGFFYAGLPALEAIVLDNNQMGQAWVNHDDIISRSLLLRSFSANNVSINDMFPNFFGNVTLFPVLERLSLARNQIEGAVIPWFWAKSKVRYLDISDQKPSPYDLRGHINFITGMLNLVEARLGHNGFTGPLPDVTHLVNLRVFDASYNHDLWGCPKFPPGALVNLTGNPRVDHGSHC